jgi:predicted Zn-dependent peptidase
MSGEHLAARPDGGTPRPYEFPPFAKAYLPNGVEVRTVHLPRRPLVSAVVAIRRGATDEDPRIAGVSGLAARALSEGTARYDAIGFVEAAERLGAELHASAGWDAASTSVEVPGTRLAPAMELLAEMTLRPSFPAHEVERLRDQRMNEILQAFADPRSRAEIAFASAIYTADSPYGRMLGGDRATVAGLDVPALRERHAAWLDPERMTIVVGGDLDGIDVLEVVGPLFGGIPRVAGVGADAPVTAASAVDRTFVRIHHRPGAVQTEVRVGHVGLRRRIPDFHAVSVMSAILGGLFGSRLNLRLREEKGYTYGAHAGFDLRVHPGPFGARAAVETDVTAAAVTDLVAEIRRMRETDVTDDELTAAKDYLIGVFPLRFETPGPVVTALAGLATAQLPDDELARYRPGISAVTAADVRRAAEEHLHPDRAAIVLLGDADRIAADVEAAGLGDVEVVREDPPAS